jgi:hypothetical protein
MVVRAESEIAGTLGTHGVAPIALALVRLDVVRGEVRRNG